MLSKRFLAATIAGAALVAGPAHAATMVAGWDFSQYYGAGNLTTDPYTFDVAKTLSANYSKVEGCDPLYGGDPGQCGTMHNDGLYGSTEVTTLGDELTPIEGSLVSNLFAADSTLTQVSLEPISSQLSIVFNATLGSRTGNDWQLDFGGQTVKATNDMNIFFSLDGQAYSLLGTAAITRNDTPYHFAMNANGASQVFLRFDFSGNWDPLVSGDVTGIPKIDNVSISANVNAIPEPGTVVLLMSGLAGLAAVGRRRD